MSTRNERVGRRAPLSPSPAYVPKLADLETPALRPGDLGLLAFGLLARIHWRGAFENDPGGGASQVNLSQIRSALVRQLSARELVGRGFLSGGDLDRFLAVA